MQSSGTRDNFDIGNASGELNDEFSEIKVNIQPKAKLKHKMSKKGLEEKKMEVLEECLHMLASWMSSKKSKLTTKSFNLWSWNDKILDETLFC